jgi:hypothetical protein
MSTSRERVPLVIGSRFVGFCVDSTIYPANAAWME